MFSLGFHFCGNGSVSGVDTEIVDCFEDSSLLMRLRGRFSACLGVTPVAVISCRDRFLLLCSEVWTVLDMGFKGLRLTACDGSGILLLNAPGVTSVLALVLSVALVGSGSDILSQ